MQRIGCAGKDVMGDGRLQPQRRAPLDGGLRAGQEFPSRLGRDPAVPRSWIKTQPTPLGPLARAQRKPTPTGLNVEAVGAGGGEDSLGRQSRRLGQDPAYSTIF